MIRGFSVYLIPVYAVCEGSGFKHCCIMCIMVSCDGEIER